MKSYWVKTTFLSGKIDVDDDGIIVFTAPIWAKWHGAPFDNFRVAHEGHDMRVRLMNETED